MNYHLTPEQIALLSIARMSWQKRGAAKRTGLGFGEESVTETILLELAESFPGQVLIVPFNKVQEGSVGADWAWAFMSADGCHVYPMLVQAKVLDLKDQNYPEIKRHIGKTSPRVRQIDRLIRTSAALGWPAVYAFYNHLNDASRIPSECRSLAMSGLPRFAPAWGISVADANLVRSALDDQSFDTHRMHSMPLHCLLCSKGSGARPPGGSAELALRGVGRLRVRGRKDDSGLELGRPGRDEILRELPQIFADAIGIFAAEDEEVREVVRRRVAERYSNIAGVVLLRDAEEYRD